MAYGGDPQRAAGVSEGDILDGKYRVERVLGVGGMGVVVAAHHMRLDERVAIKFLLPEMLSNPEVVERFAREARAAVKIKNEHVARVADVGSLPNGAPFMVMEYLDGGDLASWLKQRGPLPTEQAIEFVLQACVAVADAHALGIVHRDLKPANLFCVRRSDGQLSIKVLDFGISKMLDTAHSASGAATRTATLMGSPYYMSPEQMRSSKDVDAQTDIWALGVILFELLVGRPPFVAESVTEVAIMVASESTPPIRIFRPDVPPVLEAVILKCLEKNRRFRYRNVGELAAALLEFGPKRAKGSVDRIAGILQAAGVSASTMELPPPPEPTFGTLLAPATAPPVGRTTPGTTRGKNAIVGASIAGMIVLIAILGSVVALKRGSAPVAAGQASSPPASSPFVSQASAIGPAKPADTETAAARDVPPPATSPPVDLPSVVPLAARPTAAGPEAPATATRTSLPNGSSALARPALTAAARPPANPAPQPAAARCDPPYYFDSKGNRLFKKECL